MRIAVKQAGSWPHAFTVNVKAHPNMGRWAAFREPHGHTIYYGNVIDLVDGTGDPKRIRLQRGDPDRHGDVFGLGQFEFLWWADDEDPT